MFLGLLVLITALSISAVAIYYSVSGLVAIFAAAAIPILIMGGVLEIGKLVTAVWLHRYWREAKWWLKTYLSISVLVLMFITSMGIFGFLSKAHIEQTAAAEEGIAQLQIIDTEIARSQAIIERAEIKIEEALASVGQGNDAIQAQIDKEQERIDTAYDRIQPAIDEQNAIIANARQDDAKRTEPYEQQLASLDVELRSLAEQANQYEERISALVVDNSASKPLLDNIALIRESITRVNAQLASREREQIRQAQRTIGANPDGWAGQNTRNAADAWINQQNLVIEDLQEQVSILREEAQTEVNNERTRLSNLVASLRGQKTDEIKSRQLEILATIDQVRGTESPIIVSARKEISRLRESADTQITQSNDLIQRLRDSLTVGVDEEVEAEVEQQQQKIIEANNSIDTLTEQKYTLQAEYRKLEAEVGPVKYLAEFVYGETANQDLLEEAVRWVIIMIIFVFDPLAVLLLIASQTTFEMRRANKMADKEYLRQKEWKNYEQARAQAIVNNPGFTVGDKDDNESIDNKHDEHAQSRSVDRGSNDTDGATPEDGAGPGEDILAYAEMYHDTGTNDNGGSTAAGLSDSQKQERIIELEEKEQDINYTELKRKWKLKYPDQTAKFWKEQYILGNINSLPWEDFENTSD
jgi:hypothetical protein